MMHKYVGTMSECICVYKDALVGVVKEKIDSIKLQEINNVVIIF